MASGRGAPLISIVKSEAKVPNTPVISIADDDQPVREGATDLVADRFGIAPHSSIDLTTRVNHQANGS
jgi:hypothetical protein